MSILINNRIKLDAKHPYQIGRSKDSLPQKAHS